MRTSNFLVRYLFLASALSVALTMSSCGNLQQSETHLVAKGQKIKSGQITVDAGGSQRITIEVAADMIDPVVKGTFTTYGGSGNDIQAAIGDDQNMTNWLNGHQAIMLWETPGQVTTGSFEVSLKPGTYYLGVSNRFSVVSDKQVSLDVNLNYKQTEAVTQR